MNETRRKSFVFYVEWAEILMDYPAEVRLEVYDAVIDYVASGTTTELKPQAKMAFSFIKKQIDNNNERFEEIVSKRSAAGKKGGGNPAFKKGHPNPYYQDINDLSENEKINKDKQGLSKINTDKLNENENENENEFLKEKGNTVVLPQKKKTQEPPLPKIVKPEKADYAEYVSMTNAEYAALVERYGEQAAREMIDILDNYKGSNGRKYKSDYRAILSWVAGRWEEQQAKTRQYATNRNVNGNKGGRGFMFSREQQDAILRAADQIPD